MLRPQREPFFNTSFEEPAIIAKINPQLAAVISALADVPADQLAKASAIFHPRRVERGTMLLHAGDVPHTLLFVVSGLLRLFYLDTAGNEFTKSFCDTNDLVSAYSALLLGTPSRLFIDALEDTTLLVAEYSDYQALSAQHPCWARVNQKRAELLFIKKEQRESALLLDDAQTRYQQFLSEYPDLDRRVKQHHIASYLGITPVSLSRIRARLRVLT
ncbi:MAG: Crp/Fnr family transcriptional regulator [Roseiflexaceae bacterium]|nr:Crp/Fnr family transcriptional regulator [Roseiflexaceae bacterium]